MTRSQHWATAALVAALTLGCSSKSETPNTPAAGDSSTASSSGSGTANGSAAVAQTPVAPRQVDAEQRQQALDAAASPEAVVNAFLEATRRGDHDLAAKLLSQKALEETTRVGLTVQPPGTPSMKYTIGAIEYPEDAPGGAYVQSTWVEEYEDGNEQFDVTWVLRKQDQGWRIVGMAAQMGEDELPYFLNFEQPDELYRKIQEASGEVAADGTDAGDSQGSAESDAPGETATKPAPPVNTLR
jgi:hypothetical protein